MSPTKSAIIVFSACVFLGLAICVVWKFVSGLSWQIALTSVLLVSAFFTTRAFGLANWENIMRRRAASLLVLLSSGLVSKGLGALLFAAPTLSDLFIEKFRADGNWLYLVPAAILSGNTQGNRSLVVLGLIGLGWVVAKLTQAKPVTSVVETTDSKACVPASPIARPIIERVFRLWSEVTVPTFDSDFPPQIPIWVGRKNEIETVMSDVCSVVAITGIGGQGKSALAAKVLEQVRTTHPGVFWDWRDCREESDRFRTHLVSVLVRISNGKITAESTSDAELSWLVKRFFEYARGHTGVVVFDNVDFYVNTELQSFQEPVSVFIDEALRGSHSLRILFTCRPTVRYANIRFQNVALTGLNETESDELFRRVLKNVATPTILSKVPRFCELSQGHPLWLTLIAAQIARNPQSSDKLLRKLETGDADEGATPMLRAVWGSLGTDDKVIVRCLAEIKRAVEQKQIAAYAVDQCSSRKAFNKAFKRLLSISLLTEKRGDHQHAPRYELHPMVRSFCRHEYAGVGERQDVITKLIVICNEALITAGLSDPVRRLEHVATKVELEFNGGDVKSAVATLSESASAMIKHGLHEELVRLGRLLLQDVAVLRNHEVWGESKFHLLMHSFCRTLTELGRYEEAKKMASSYEAKVGAGTAHQIGVCEFRCYMAWFAKDYVAAIEYGERGVELKNKSGIDTKHDASHSLALAQRDSGNVTDSLSYFLRGETIEDLLCADHRSSGRDSTHFGNIGRCLALIEEYENALACYVRSFDLLERENDQSTELNRGFASLWIGEVMVAMGCIPTASHFLRNAVYIWKEIAPHRADEVRSSLADSDIEYASLTDEDYVEASVFCKQWVSQRLLRVGQDNIEMLGETGAVSNAEPLMLPDSSNS